MSASIHYRVVTLPDGRIDVSTPSAFVEAMRRAFGDPPWRLGGPDLVKLDGMRCAFDAPRGMGTFQTLMDKIQQPDGSLCTIEVWPEY